MKSIKEFTKYLYNSRYLHFLLVGGSGVALNLLIVFISVEFYFGEQNYFYGYLLGLFSNLAYNFTLNTISVFKTKNNHVRRLSIFSAYHLLMSFIQASIIKTITPFFGEEYYLIIIGTTIFLFSIITFGIFKLWLFKERD